MNGIGTAAGHRAPPVTGAVIGAKAAVGQPNGTVKGAGVVANKGTVGATGIKGVAGTVGATVGITGGIAGTNVGGTTGVKVGATTGVKVGATVGVKVGARLHHMAPGNVIPVIGSVGATVGVKGVGQNVIPPTGAVIVGVKGRVGAAIGVIPGASVGAVGNVIKGGRITAEPYDEKRLKAIIKNKLMRKSLSDLI